MPYLSSEDLSRVVLPVALQLFGGHNPRLVSMPGGASPRRFHRVTLEAGARASLVVMELGEVVAGELPFMNVQRYLARAGVAVPAIHRYDAERGLLYVDDLGDATFESRVHAADDDARARYYRLAIDELVRMQRYATESGDRDCVAFSRGFDLELLTWELDHFREYGLEAQGHQLSPAQRAELDRHFHDIAEELAAAPRLVVHRDYQSRNLMVLDGPSIAIVDFQDALLGTAPYDLVALLRDSYVALSPSLLESLVAYYVEKSGREPNAFRRLFDLQVVQRKLKDAGRFVFIDRKKNNPSFLKHIPNSLEYAASSIKRLPELDSLREILAGFLPNFSK
jgi:aminoglycoside/choline kinase family phosphotransferase